MNTKQKLTLGIAAIFMVTLTIVGVTYAYFVTRVTGATTTNVNVSTATIGEVRYVDEGSAVVNLANVLPGDPAVYKAFSVTNDSEDASTIGVYNLFVDSTVVDGKPHFVKATSETNCYKSTAVQNITGTGAQTGTAGCFDGTAYNNIKISLYEVDSNPTTGTGSNELTAEQFATLTKKTTVTEDTLLQVGTKVYETGLEVKGGAEGAAGKTRHYVLKVQYVNNGQNQNIENLAQVNIRTSIS